MVNSDPAHQSLFQFRPRALRPIVLVELLGQLFLLSRVDDLLAFDLVCDRPTLFTVKTKNQSGRVSGIGLPLHHRLCIFRKQFVFDPVEAQRDFAIMAFHQIQFAVLPCRQPVTELTRIADGRGNQQRLDVLRQQPQPELPDDPSLAIVKAVELVHHHRPHFVKVKRIAMEQSVQQNFCNDDFDLGVWVDFTVPGHEPHVVC